MNRDILDRVHVGFADLLDKRRSKPEGGPELLGIQSADRLGRRHRIVDSLRRSRLRRVQTVDEMTDGPRPEGREVDEVSDQSDAQLPGHHGPRAMAQRLQQPAHKLDQEALCVCLAEFCTGRDGGCQRLARSDGKRKKRERERERVSPIPVQLDYQGQGSIELDIVIRTTNQALRELPAARGSLQSLQSILNPGNCLGTVGFIERSYRSFYFGETARE